MAIGSRKLISGSGEEYTGCEDSKTDGLREMHVYCIVTLVASIARKIPGGSIGSCIYTFATDASPCVHTAYVAAID